MILVLIFCTVLYGTRASNCKTRFALCLLQDGEKNALISWQKVLLLTLRFVNRSRRVIPEVSGCSVRVRMEWAVVLGLQWTPLHLFWLRFLHISFNWRQLQVLYIWVRAAPSQSVPKNRQRSPGLLSKPSG